MLTPRNNDVSVYRRDPDSNTRTSRVESARPQFFDGPIIRIERGVSCGMDEIILEFEAGGKVCIFTDRPLLFVEPNRH